MNPYYNLPHEQRPTQRLVDQYDADARLWKKLSPLRRARRKLLRLFLSPKVLKDSDLLEFSRQRLPEDCVAQEIEP